MLPPTCEDNGSGYSILQLEHLFDLHACLAVNTVVSPLWSAHGIQNSGQ